MPAPGGGSAAALCAAMSASLVSMACRYTLGKEKYKLSQDSIKKILKKSVLFEKRLAGLVDKDIEAYASKDFKKAIQTPAQICSLSYELLELIDELLVKGNRNLLSDVALAAMLAESSFIGGLFYIRVNVKALGRKMRRYQKLVDEFSLLLKKVKTTRERVEDKVGKDIGR